MRILYQEALPIKEEEHCPVVGPFVSEIDEAKSRDRVLLIRIPEQAVRVILGHLSSKPRSVFRGHVLDDEPEPLRCVVADRVILHPGFEPRQAHLPKVLTGVGQKPWIFLDPLVAGRHVDARHLLSKLLPPLLDHLDDLVTVAG